MKYKVNSIISTFIIFSDIKMFSLLSVLVEILAKTTPGTSPGLQFVLKGNNSSLSVSQVTEKLLPPACSILSTKSVRKRGHH